MGQHRHGEEGGGQTCSRGEEFQHCITSTLGGNKMHNRRSKQLSGHMQITGAQLHGPSSLFPGISVLKMKS